MSSKVKIAAPNILLMGPAGTGKTYSVASLVESGIEVFYVGLENGIESLLGYWADQGKPIPANLRWNVIEAPKASLAEMLEISDKVGIMSFDALTKMSDPNKAKYDHFSLLLKCLNNFVDQRTGESFGCAEDWGPERAVVIDGLTGLGNAVMSRVVGGKPVKSQPDWGLAQTLLEGFLRKMCDGCPCWFVLLCHVEREQDLVLGGIKIMPSTLGKALAPKLASMFSDVAMTVREGNKWTWDCAHSQADVKARNLPWQSNITPNFAQIVAKWKARSEAV